jgi:hypothetical protein
MADEKLTQIRVSAPFQTPLADDDLLYIVQNTGTSPEGRAITGDELSTALAAPLGVSDGDKGDITKSGETWTIDNNAVTFAKMQGITDGKLLGASGGTIVEEITVGAGLSFSSNTLSAASDGWTASSATWTYSSVDDPTGVITVNADLTAVIGIRDRIKFTNGGNTIYGIVSKTPTFSSPNTTITFLHQIDPTDNLALVLMANSAITAPYYSHVLNPFGFPASPLSWRILVTDTAERLQDPVENTVYNLGTVTVSAPIGLWDIEAACSVYVVGGTNPAVTVGISTTGTSFSDANMTSLAMIGAGAQASRYITSPIVCTAKTSYYLNEMVGNTDATSLRINTAWGGEADVTKLVLKSRLL